jgi:RNA polymerase sigma factor (sigma-70 family)
LTRNDSSLFERIQAGDSAAEAEVLRRNMPLVHDIARRYHVSGGIQEDLIQEGAIGLLKAARKFDPSRGNRFSTLATWWVRQAISRFVKGPTRTIRLPEYVHDRIARVLRVQRELEAGEAPASLEDVARFSQQTPEKVRKLLDYSQDVIPLDSPVRNRADLTVERSVPDRGRSVDEEVAHRRDQRALVDGLRTLPSRQTEILAYRFGLADGRKRSRAWIGDRLGISGERVRQLEKKALTNLQHEMQSVAA